MEKETNAEFASKNEAFRNACSSAGIQPTKRQAGKFRRKAGKAYKTFSNKGA